jgi:hypothetical protein
VLAQPLELCAVEYRRGQPDVGEVEVLGYLLAREDLLVSVGPAEARQVVEERLRHDPRLAKGLHARGPVALGQAILVRPEDQGDMREGRRRVPESAVTLHLLRRVRQVVITPDHVRDLHRHVVHHRAEIVGGRAVGADEDPVVELAVVEHHRAVEKIFHHGLPLLGDTEAEGMRLVRGDIGLAAGARVAEGLGPGLGRLPQRVELGGRAPAAVGPALGKQPLGMGAVDLEALALLVTRGGRALVPVEPEPGQGVEDGGEVLLGGALEVSVLDPEDEYAVMAPGEGPVEERGAGAPHMQMAGRAGSKAHAHGLGHGPLYPARNAGAASPAAAAHEW